MKSRLIFCIVLAAVCITAAALIAQVPVERSTLPKPEESPLFVERYSELQPNERISVQVYESVNRSVVNIDTQTTRMVLFGEIDVPGAGSGIVLDKQGHILTNSHVIANIDACRVTLYNGESYDAVPVGEDPVTDLAVIKINAPAETLYPIQFGDSSKLLVGQQIFAIGNPFGLERTLTSGIISSLNRSIPGRIESRSIKGIIQVDAPINPGNSGGALLDTKGRCIGVNTAIASTKSGGSHGVGFAVPCNTISRIAPQLIKNGKVIRGEIGIGAVREIEREFQNGKVLQGLLVRALVQQGAAEKAGLRGPKIIKEHVNWGGMPSIRQRFDPYAADIIVGIDGQPTKKVDDFTSIIDDHKPGDSVVLDVYREGKIAKVSIVLE
ncbi:serine protease [Planctomycetales bacterium]|nr:serine protease [Planctomycetales bacterium]